MNKIAYLIIFISLIRGLLFSINNDHSFYLFKTIRYEIDPSSGKPTLFFIPIKHPIILQNSFPRDGPKGILEQEGPKQPSGPNGPHNPIKQIESTPEKPIREDSFFSEPESTPKPTTQVIDYFTLYTPPTPAQPSHSLSPSFSSSPSIPKSPNTFPTSLDPTLPLFYEKPRVKTPYYHLYFLSLRRNQGDTIGDVGNYTTLETLSFPYGYANFWPFLDLRGHIFDDKDRFAANAGLGFRMAPSFTNYILGVNTYYDYRNVHHTAFSQLGIGMELLGICTNFRLNGYFPVGKKKTRHSFCLTNYEAGYFLLRENFKHSLKGVQFEVETLISKICSTEIFMGIGAYYYKGNKCQGDIYGSEYRVSIQPSCDYVEFNLYATHDCRFKTRFQAELTFTLPFGCSSQFDNRFFQPIRRHEIIAIDKRSRWTWNF